MKEKIQEYTDYLINVKRNTKNTVEAYVRDLNGMVDFFLDNGINEIDKITYTDINSYILYLEKNGKSAATINRSISSMKTFFHFMLRRGYISAEPTELVQPPRVKKKKREVSSPDIIERLLRQPKGDEPIILRDRAMLQLLCDTGMRVSEITDICVSDVNLAMNYIICRNSAGERIIPFKRAAGHAIERYLSDGRSALTENSDGDYLFVNCRGGKLSRQGLWKIVKDYAKKAGIEEVITPQSVRNSTDSAKR